MLHWVKNIFGLTWGITWQATRQGVQYLEKKVPPKLIDVTEGAFLAEKSRELNIAMQRLLYNRSLEKERTALKRRVRRRVKHSLEELFAQDMIVDEVTERLTDAAISDSFYKKWFE